MRNRRSAVAWFLLAAPILALLGAGPPAASETPVNKVELAILDLGPDGLIRIGIHIVLEPGWHLYWANPGEAGIPPSVRWTLPPGFSAGPLRHPVPVKFVDGGLVTFGHKDEVLLLCEIAPPDGTPGSAWEAAAVLEWMACLESCLTGEALIRAGFPPSAPSLAEGRRLYEQWAARFPRPFSESGLSAGQPEAAWTGSAWRLEVALSGPRAVEACDFFVYPVEGFVIDNAAVSCRDGRIVAALVPSLGAGAAPPAAVNGVLVIEGTGYEFSAPVGQCDPRPAAVPRDKGGSIGGRSIF